VTAAPPTPQRMAATWFLGLLIVAVIIFAWMRGLGRIVVPLLAIGGAVLVLSRAVKALRAPVD